MCWGKIGVGRKYWIGFFGEVDFEAAVVSMGSGRCRYGEKKEIRKMK